MYTKLQDLCKSNLFLLTSINLDGVGFVHDQLDVFAVSNSLPVGQTHQHLGLQEEEGCGVYVCVCVCVCVRRRRKGEVRRVNPLLLRGL